MNIKHILLIFILLIGTFFRIYKINFLPPSINYDEIDAGYQAMIFNQNHTDYYANKYPVHFRSFGDYRTSLHIYSIAFIQKIINNPEISIRLTSSIYGILTIFIFYLITKSLIPSFLLSISPWFIHYNRIGFEASGMIFYFLLAIYFWKKFITKKDLKNLLLTCLFLCLMPYFYSTAKLFILIIVLIFLLVWWTDIKKIGIKNLIISLVFSVFLLVPMGIDTLNGKAGHRFSYIGIFTMPHREQIVDTLRYQDAIVNHPNEIGVSTSLLSKIFHNKYQLIIKKFISNYINSFSPEFFFLIGDRNIRQGFGNHGLLYLVDFIFIFIGLYSSLHQKKTNKLTLFFFYLLILSPIPFSLTRDSDYPHATRLILMLPSLIYFIFKGIKFIQKKFNYSIFIISFLYLISFINFWHYYYYHYPQESADVWNTGMKEVVLYTNNFTDKPIIFSDSYLSFVSHFLFYHPYNIKPKYSLSNNLVPYSNESFSGQLLDNKYYFGKINWTNLSSYPKDSIFVIPETEKSQVSPLLKLIEKISKKYEMAQNFYIYQFNNQ